MYYSFSRLNAPGMRNGNFEVNSVVYFRFEYFSDQLEWIRFLNTTSGPTKYGSLFMHRIKWYTAHSQQTCYANRTL